MLTRVGPHWRRWLLHDLDSPAGGRKRFLDRSLGAAGGKQRRSSGHRVPRPRRLSFRPPARVLDPLQGAPQVAEPFAQGVGHLRDVPGTKQDEYQQEDDQDLLASDVEHRSPRKSWVSSLLMLAEQPRLATALKGI
jgi:hypothetical protein